MKNTLNKLAMLMEQYNTIGKLFLDVWETYKADSESFKELLPDIVALREEVLVIIWETLKCIDDYAEECNDNNVPIDMNMMRAKRSLMAVYTSEYWK